MALVLSPWFGRAGCGRRARFSCGGPASLFTDLVIVKVPVQRQACAPVSKGDVAPAMAKARAVQWAETAEEQIFKLRLPGLRKEDVHIQIEDDRTLYIRYSCQAKEGTDHVKEGEESTKSQCTQQKPGSCSSFMRKFKLPENADLEHITAQVADETLTVTVPKRKMPSSEILKIDVTESKPTITSHATANAPSDHMGKASAEREASTPRADSPSTST